MGELNFFAAENGGGDVPLATRASHRFPNPAPFQPRA
jgi:hypothetical protein